MISGTKDVSGRPLIFMEGAEILKDNLTRYELAKVLLYYVTVPDKADVNGGVTVLLKLGLEDGQGSDHALFDLLDQAFYLAKKQMRVHIVIGWKHNSSKATAIYQQRWQRSVAFPKSNVQVSFLEVSK